MIVGKGLIASVFENTNHDDLLIFASGVSNSLEIVESEYSREVELFNESVNSYKYKTLIYFSTCSIFDPLAVKSQYVKFKLAREKQILESESKAIIVRLPQILGKSSNHNQLGPFLRNAILNNEKFDLFVNACRYLMFSEDLSSILEMILENKSETKIFNVAFDNKVKMLDIVKSFGDCLGMKPVFSEIEKGSCYDIPNRGFLSLYYQSNLKLTINYDEVIHKFIKSYAVDTIDS